MKLSLNTKAHVLAQGVIGELYVLFNIYVITQIFYVINIPYLTLTTIKIIFFSNGDYQVYK